MRKTINDFALLEPMKYYNNENDCPKRQDMINNKDDKYMATVKKDGDWAMLIHYSKGTNLIRSRSISKVTGVYGDYTAKLPHICELMDKLPDSTVLLAELCWDEPGTNANSVGTILRCLPAKAVERQKEKKLKAVVFDMLMIDDIDMTDQAYMHRFIVATDAMERYIFPSNLMYMTQLCPIDEHHDSFLEWADEIIRDGGEGLVIQYKDNPYMPGTRTAWRTLKLKQKLESAEYLVIDTINPKREYEGILVNTWKYWDCITDEGVIYINRDYEEPLFQDLASKGYQLTPITKPYYYGWKNGIRILLPSGIETDVSSGLTDDDCTWLSSPDAAKAIRNHDLYAEVAAMSVNDLGKLRHAYVVRLRLREDGVGSDD